MALLALCACSHGLVIDPSIPAVEAGDETLISSLCEAVPNGGMDVCHVKEGTAIQTGWKLVVPDGFRVDGGEVDVYYRDIHKQYGVTKNVINIPFRDFFGSTTWGPQHDGEALALVLIRYRTDQGIQEIMKFRGIAKIVVTKPGYDRMPIDSGFAAWGTTCKVQYSTAGRSALKCK